MRCRGWPPRSWRSRLSRGAGPRCRGESPELAAGTAKGSASLQKVRMASPSCTPPRHSKRAPCPAPTPLSPTAAELKITSPVAPRRPRPRPLPRPSPTGRGAKPRLPVPPKRGGKKKTERKKERKGGAGGERGAGRGRGAQPYGCDFSAPRQTGRSAALGARPPPARPQAASLPPPSLSPLRRFVLSLALGGWAPRRAPGPRAARTPGSPRPGRGRGGPA